MIVPYDPRTTPPSIRHRFWSFANSNFGLWLFSGLLVGVLTFSWSEYKDAKNARLERERQLSRLRTEIRARVERCYRLIQTDWNEPTGVPLDRRLHQAGVAGPPQSVVVFPEFKDRPLSSLFWEIRTLGPDEQDLFATAQGVSEEFETRAWAQSEPGSSSLPLDDDYAYHLAMLSMLRSTHARAMEAGLQRLLAEHPPVSQQEHEEYIRTQWPEYAKLKKEIERQQSAERARKLRILERKHKPPVTAE